MRSPPTDELAAAPVRLAPLVRAMPGDKLARLWDQAMVVGGMLMGRPIPPHRDRQLHQSLTNRCRSCGMAAWAPRILRVAEETTAAAVRH